MVNVSLGHAPATLDAKKWNPLVRRTFLVFLINDSGRQVFEGGNRIFDSVNGKPVAINGVFSRTVLNFLSMVSAAKLVFKKITLHMMYSTSEMYVPMVP
jgi:hypothetical protein